VITSKKFFPHEPCRCLRCCGEFYLCGSFGRLGIPSGLTLCTGSP